MMKVIWSVLLILIAGILISGCTQSTVQTPSLPTTSSNPVNTIRSGLITVNQIPISYNVTEVKKYEFPAISAVYEKNIYEAKTGNNLVIFNFNIGQPELVERFVNDTLYTTDGANFKNIKWTDSIALRFENKETLYNYTFGGMRLYEIRENQTLLKVVGIIKFKGNSNSETIVFPLNDL